MWVGFMFGRDPIALTVNNLSAKVSMENLAMGMESRFNTEGRMDAWTRLDLHSKTYKTTNKDGPTWKNVAYRVIADGRSGDLTRIEDATNVNRDEEHILGQGETA